MTNFPQCCQTRSNVRGNPNATTRSGSGAIRALAYTHPANYSHSKDNLTGSNGQAKAAARTSRQQAAATTDRKGSPTRLRSRKEGRRNNSATQLSSTAQKGDKSPHG